MQSSKATDSTSTGSKDAGKFNFMDALAKLKKLNSGMDVATPVMVQETSFDVKTVDSYEDKKKKELTKRVIREFTKAESEKDASEPQREINR